MKRLLTVGILLTWMSLFMSGFVLGSEPQPAHESITNVKLLTWATASPIQWGRGLLLGGLGLVGALVTVFGLIGGTVPGTAGQAQIDADNARLNTYYEQLKRLMATSPPDGTAIEAVERAVNNLRDDLRAERWRQFGIAAFFYVILGGAVATILAADILQALVIGAGWTGWLGTLGLKADYAKRKELKDTVLEETLERAGKAETLVRSSGNANLISALSSDPWEDNVRVAKAL
ncbi:MAG: hypothetical protein MUC41_01575 [Syntrophobacteraceae bacterium]|jgi:hypothetical protein|nr:hypothetical protein [Syntrophobacteraceae bacterium]